MSNSRFCTCYETPKTEVLHMCCQEILMSSDFSYNNENPNEAFGKNGALQEFEW